VLLASGEEVTMTQSRTASHAIRLALVALILTVVAACSSEAPATSDSAPPADAVLIEVSAVEFAFSLSDTPTTAGTYTFELTNDGSMSHDLVIEGVNGAATDIVGPGATDSFTVTLEPGEYTMYCSVGNHRAQGMEVTFTVT
jgi:plastocyanin